ncbi:MAG: hypothetical protein ABWZ91_14240 [Nocardioides sp.]|jgi:hypothetical protein
MSSRTTVRTLAAAVGLATAAAVLVSAPSSQAAARADNVVTIKAEGTDLSGTVKSKRRACKNERKVFLVKQKGAKGGSDDKVIASDTTELDDGVGVWSTGNTGIEGRFYAKIKRTPLCKAAVSRTVRAIRED